MDLRSFNVQDVFYSFIGVFEKFIFLQKKKKKMRFNEFYNLYSFRLWNSPSSILLLVVRYYIILKL